MGEKYKLRYDFARKIGVPVFLSKYHPQIIGQENIVNEGPIIFCGNHLHVFDQFPIISSTKRVTHWMSKKEYFDGKLGFIFKNTGAICVDRFGDSHKSMVEAEEYLNNGSAVGIFPEGTRNGVKEEVADNLYQLSTTNCKLHDEDNLERLNEFKEILLSKKTLYSQVLLLKKKLQNKEINSEEFYNILKLGTINYYRNLFESGNISDDEYFDSLLLPFYDGAFKMAKDTNSTIIPFCVTGDYTSSNNNLTARIGEPINTENVSKKLVRSKIINLIKENKYFNN